MAIQLLERIHGPSVSVIAIFMKGKSQRTPEDFTTAVMESIHHQLIGNGFEEDSTFQSYDGSTCTSQPRNIKELRRSIYTALHHSPHTFLVIDDLDQCGYQSVQLLEEELDKLRAHGLRIMITSRVARYETRYWLCDAGGGHSITADCEVWLCSKCYEGAEQLDGEEKEEMLGSFVTCTSCKNTREAMRTCSK